MFSSVYKLMHKMQRNKHRPNLATHAHTHVHTHVKEVSTQPPETGGSVSHISIHSDSLMNALTKRKRKRPEEL